MPGRERTPSEPDTIRRPGPHRPGRRRTRSRSADRMALDEALLGAHRRFEDPALGYSEEFLQPTLGGRKTVAVLSLPLQSRQPLGWVICHSFGIEQVHLGRLDTMVARALAGAGFPVVRFHGRGYGDSEGSVEEISLSSHL